VLKLSQSRQSGSGLQGVLFVVAGTWLLLESLAIVHVSFWQLWPLLLVLFGTSMVLRGLRGRGAAIASDGNSTVSALAILSGVSRGNNSHSFKGGDLTSVMGGCEIDLRQATIEGEAVLDVFAMWGGIEIRVPEDWTVVSRVTPVLGGFEDKTRPSQTAIPRRLIVRGMVVMGGVEVKN
jgi:predicted membrane protein